MGHHPIREDKEFERFLGECEEIELTHHFEHERLPRRPNISREMIEDYLSSLEDLIEFEYQEDDNPRPKYSCLFDKSSKYYLKIVLSVENKTIYIVTSHLINKSKAEMAKKLL